MVSLISIFYRILFIIIFVDIMSKLLTMPLIYLIAKVILIMAPIYILVRHFLQKQNIILPKLRLPFKKNGKNAITVGFLIGVLMPNIALIYLIISSLYIAYSFITDDISIVDLLKN